jgi:hypothetical protein
MKAEKIDKGLEESPANTAQPGHSCCGMRNFSYTDTDCVEEMSGRIGDLWLMISLV